MANQDDYTLEELENSAVKKSTMAKRAVLGVGLLGAGAATAYGAEQMASHDDTDNDDKVTEESLSAAAKAGAVESNPAANTTAQATQAPQAAPEPETINVHHYVHQVEPEPQPSEDDLTFDTTTHYVDENGNIVATVDSGTLEGKAFQVVDLDGDGYGDVLGYDANGDGKLSEDELTELDGKTYQMGHGEHHRDLSFETGEPVGNVHGDGPHDSYDISDIHNDFQEEKSGEEYHNDLAELAKENGDYDNRAEVGHYTAGLEDGSNDIAIEPIDERNETLDVDPIDDNQPEIAMDPVGNEDVDTGNFDYEEPNYAYDPDGAQESYDSNNAIDVTSDFDDTSGYDLA